jgi:moderate conductance mechanosensitive channel
MLNFLKVSLFEGGVRIGNFEITQNQVNEIIITVIRLILILIAMYIVIKVGSFLIEKTVKKKSDHMFSLDEKKAQTLGAILSSILRYMVYFFGIGGILSVIFGPISLTFAGIGGVAIGFGAQSFVKDVINGIFILFEDHFSVGDVVSIDSKMGVVESMELRVTKVRDFNGDLHIIPNGNISQVTNRSRGNMRILVDIDIAYEEDVDNAINVLSEACEDFKVGNEDLLDGPSVMGVADLKDSGVTIRIVGRVKPMTQVTNENLLRKELKKTLDRAGIEIPYPRRKIIN